MEQQTPRPTQPFTFAGVAKYAYARPLRVLLTALVIASVAGAATAWTTGSVFAPVLEQALAVFPPAARIEQGQLIWPESSGRQLAGNPFLSIEVLREGEVPFSPPADFVVELGDRQFSIRSLFGWTSISYPRAALELDRTSLLPAWGAWEAPLIAGVGVFTAFGLIAAWSVLAVAYGIPLFFLAGLARRDLTFGEAWKLAMAAQWTGALLMSFTLVLYSMGEAGLLFLVVMLGVHFIPALFYLLMCPLFLRRSSLADGDPFGAGRKPRKKNPFSGAA